MKNKDEQNKDSEITEEQLERRKFITRLGQGLLLMSTLSLVSMTQFACKKDDNGPGNGGGY